MFEFLIQHKSWISVLVYWIFSAAVSSMPEPEKEGSAGYLWLYRFCQTTAGNIGTLFGNKLPGLKSILPFLILPVLFFATTACAAHHYTVHPGALNAVDSGTYDALLVAEAEIDQARAGNQAQPLSPDVKSAFNRLVVSYNAARDAYLTYRSALATNAPADVYLKQLNNNLSDLVEAIRRLEQAK
jgi:hypothetical protein